MPKIKVKITRSVFIDRVTKKEGEIVEVEKNFGNELITTNAAELIEEAESGDELIELKAKADELGVKYTKKTNAEELTKLIEEAEIK